MLDNTPVYKVIVPPHKALASPTALCVWLNMITSQHDLELIAVDNRNYIFRHLFSKEQFAHQDLPAILKKQNS